MIVGIANIVPGVSGATLAVIFKLYDRLIEAINSLFTDTKNSLKFLIPFGLGMGIGIIAFGSLIDILLTRFSLPAGALIAGLMAGSIPFIYKMATENCNHKPVYYTATVVAALAIVAMVLFAPTPEIYAETDLTIAMYILLFVAGFLGAAAMVIPGVSGSMVLILFGVFPIAMHTISLIREYLATPLDFTLLSPIVSVVVPVGLGIVIGIFATSRLIEFLLKKYHSITYCAILGLVLGTIFVIFSDDATYQSHDNITIPLIIIAAVIFVIGVVVSIKLGKK